MVTESLEHAVLAKESSQPKSTYEVAASLTEFELKKILIDKMDESQSYLIATEHRECYDGLIKRQVSIKSSRKSVQTEEPEFKVADSDMPQNQDENLEPTNPDWNVVKTPQQGPTQTWLTTLASSADKPSKTFDKLMSTPIDFSAYIMNGLKITNLTQETLLGPTFKLLKGTRTNFAELEYDFEECYKALSEKLDWDNPEGGDYPFDLTKPLPLVMNENRQMVEVMQKHGYGYLREIEVRRADNNLYTFKESDFPRLHEFYKLNDGTLTRLRTLLDDITKNILMEYLPQRRWSSLEKKIAHIMIKAIDKQLKERRMMMSFKNFVGSVRY
ncbi:hypothetical protein Tco_0151801 [Tanacetum coccineum]